MDVEDKLELLYGIETQFTFTRQYRIPLNDIKARFMKCVPFNSGNAVVMIGKTLHMRRTYDKKNFLVLILNCIHLISMLFQNIRLPERSLPAYCAVLLHVVSVPRQ